MALPWGMRRQFLYYGVAAVIAAVLMLVGWKLFGSATPTCSDGVQNGTEIGVDCGGSCVLMCKESVHIPVLLWARAFRTSSSTYTAAAYVQNNNIGAGAHRVEYTFQLYDENNSLIASQDGISDIPPVQIIPILEPNIFVGTRSVVRTQFTFTNLSSWSRVDKSTLANLRITKQNLSYDGSRLSATVVNNSSTDVASLMVIAVLFDTQGRARAISRSTIGELGHNTSQDIVFTWNGGTPDVVRAEVTLLPSF